DRTVTGVQTCALPISTNVAALARNDTKKLRLINVWAIWCAPCVKEFPGLVSVSHRFANRDFEVITISVDDPKDEAKVKQFLDKRSEERRVGKEGNEER